MISRLAKHFGGTALALAVTTLGVGAQGLPPPSGAPAQSANPICVRLETQLAAVDHGTADAGRADQIRRYEESVAKQQNELDRTVAQARRIGCESSGFFLLFGGGQPQQCGDLNANIQRLRANLDRSMADLQRLQAGGLDRGEQRRSILASLAQNDCGPQYRTAAAAPPPQQRPRNFFEMLFGGPAHSNPGPEVGTMPNPDLPQSSTYRTLCVRTCDGFYFPISFATVPSRFRDDERACQRMCPAGDVMLFAHRNPGEDVSRAVTISGKPYTELPNAFRFRQEFNPACTCKGAGQSWAEALGGTDVTIERGDIVVTDETAKAMAQPKSEPGKPSKQETRKGKADSKPTAEIQAPAEPPAAAVNQPAPVAPAGDPATSVAPAGDAAADKRPIRQVGPQFYPRDR
jgi:hypothetical protein